MQPRFDGSKICFGGFGDLFEGEIFQVVQQKNGAMRERQGFDQRHEGGLIFTANENFVRRFGIANEVIMHLFLEETIVLALAPPELNAALMGDPEEPGAELLVVAQAVKIADRVDESLLHDIQGGLLVSHEFGHERVEGQLVAPEEDVPGGGIPRAGGRNRQGFEVGGQWHAFEERNAPLRKRFNAIRTFTFDLLDVQISAVFRIAIDRNRFCLLNIQQFYIMSQPRPSRGHFASDNYSGICPEAWQALADANQGHVRSYGDDPWTAKAADLIRGVFETNCEVFFVFNGTAANSLSLASLCQSYHSIICHEIAHVETDECGAPEFFSNGTKVLLASGANGKVEPAALDRLVHRRADIHFPKPRAFSVTQATEVGTVYSAEELAALGKNGRELGLKMHMDGARFANAVATLGLPPKAITWQAGVDVLCFGGTKNGTHVGDAVVFFNLELAHEFAYRCKQAGQLASKMRFLAAPWVGMLESGAWLRHAAHANAMAELLREKLAEIPEVKILFPRQANSVFAELPEAVVKGLWNRGWMFYTFIGKGGCRLMCSWDTKEDDINDLIADLKTELLASKSGEAPELPTRSEFAHSAR